MKKFIASIGVAAFLLLAAQASNAAIVTANSSLIMNSSQLVEWRCRVTQTAGAADYMMYPGGKVADCYYGGSQVSFNWCTTNASAGHTCTTGTTAGPAYEGSYTFLAIGAGHNGSGWVMSDVTPRGLACASDFFCYQT